jgi:isoleucyl-tRNA synthetase
MYSHPFTEEELPFLIGKHVTSEKGTGLVHTAPAHGHESTSIMCINIIQNIKALAPKL